MKIQQFYDKHLSHASYAILNEGKIALIDPARDPQQYYDFANDHNAEIIYVLETHPHADFVSSHLEIKNKTGADILINGLAGPTYSFRRLNHNDRLTLGTLTIQALHTPGHSPDSNSYLITNPKTKEQALFTGGFLFIGDVGRPNLREHVGNTQEARKDLAEAMYTSITTILPMLDDDVIIYPAHGAGSLCGKNLSNKLFDTLGSQRNNNWALQETISKEDFVNTLLSDQPFIPKYFTHCVEVNRKETPDFKKFIEGKELSYEDITKEKSSLIIDTRTSEAFRSSSYKKALNLPASDSDKFETWLGSIIAPDEQFILIVESEESEHKIYARIQKIVYEKNTQGYYIADTKLTNTKVLPVESDIQNHHEYLFLDIRQEHEHHEHKAFEHA